MRPLWSETDLSGSGHYVKYSQDVVFPGSSDLGDPTVVIPSVEGKYNYVAND